MELLLNENNAVAFELTIEGTNSKVHDIRLMFDLPQCAMAFKGTYKNGVVEFEIPNLSNVIQEGSYKYKLEVIIDEHYFIPIDGNATFKKPVRVSSKLVSEKKVVKGITVESKVIEVQKPSFVPPVVAPVTVGTVEDIFEEETDSVEIQQHVTQKDPKNTEFMTKIRGILNKK